MYAYFEKYYNQLKAAGLQKQHFAKKKESKVLK